jgi:phosphopentomutase
MICNKPYSGTAVINDYGEEHLESGKLIVYTSADSVLQIAAHTDLVPLEQFYEYCRQARSIMVGERYGVGRIIARPFVGEAGNFYRTADRHDYSLEPPCALLPDAIKNSGMDTIAIGKISDIFAGQGFTQSTYTHSNAEGMSVCEQMLDKSFRGLCFVNLVDFDMLWGHRRDALAYTQGLNDFDAWLSGFIGKMSDSDVLIITADHGCDPAYLATTDHTRECTPCIIYSKQIEAGSAGVRNTFADIAATVSHLLGVEYECDGRSMI